MKILAFIFFLPFLFFLNLNSNAQVKTGGHAIYNIENHFNSINKKFSPGLEKIFLQLKKISKKVEFSLFFNNLESKFKMEDVMLSDVDNKLLYKLLNNGVFYIDNKGKVIQKIELSDEIYLVIDSLKNKKWKLVNETKKIGKYFCYKATTKKTVKTNKTYVKNVTAWYCPEIPYPYGPEGYGGLPGLILELSIENENTYSIKSIEFNKKVNIKKFRKGKIVNPEEFNNITKQVLLMRKGMN